jgi:hypothetical protein
MKEAIKEVKKYGRRKSRSEWIEINALWEKNPKPLKMFCAELDISYTSFVYWRGLLKKEKGRQAGMPLFAMARRKEPKGAITAIVPTATSSPLKIHYPNGVVLNLYCELNSQVISVLKSLMEIESCH